MKFTTLGFLQAVGGISSRVFFAAFALVLLVLEILASEIPEAESGPRLVWTVALCVALALTGWFPGIGGVLFTVCCVPVILFPAAVVTIVFPLVGIYAVAASWIVRHWYVGAAIIVIITGVLSLLNTDAVSPSVVGMLVGSFFAVVAGFTIQWNQRRLLRLRDQVKASREMAEQAEASLRRDITSTLHDTLAGDLVKIIVASQSLAADSEDPELVGGLKNLGEIAQDAMKHLRKMMSDLGSTDDDQTLESLLATCHTMLAYRKIQIDAEFPADIDVVLTRQQRSIIGLILREGATNLLKYAKTGTTTNVTIETASTGVVITMVNEVGTPRSAPPEVMSGGFGLANLAERVSAVGGTIQYGSSQGSWVLAAQIPTKLATTDSSDNDLEKEIANETAKGLAG